MLKRLLITFTLITLVAVYGGAAPIAAAAASQPNAGQAQALEIAPPIINLTVNPGQTATVAIYLRDIAKTNLFVSGEANDFVASGEDGTPKLLLDGTDNNPYSMKNWIASLPTLNLIPQEIKAMTVTLNVPKDASPGGHYGVIRFTATPPGFEGTGVALSASLGALMLVTVTGKINENISVAEFSANQNGHTSSFFETPPINLVERFKNNGNIHEEPTGQIIIKDMLGRTFAGINVNSPPHNILPASIRKFQEALDQHAYGSGKVMFGRYTADLRVTYGASGAALTSQISFWVIPYKLIIGIIIGAVLAFFLLRSLIRGYNRRIVAKAQRTRRR